MRARLTLCSLLVVASLGGVTTERPADAMPASDYEPDFDGDGYSDLAVGIPSDDDAAPDAGAVVVLYGGRRGLSGADQRWTQDSVGVANQIEAGDRFGGALAWGDFDRDGFTDLAIGAPGEDVGSAGDAGAIHVLYGSGRGLTSSSDDYWTQDTDGVRGIVEPPAGAGVGDSFGASLTAADFDADGDGDLAIGVPGEDVGDEIDAGAVNVLYGTRSGLSAGADDYWTEDSPDVNGVAESVATDDGPVGDGFGSALAAGDLNCDGIGDLAIGIPNESIGPDDPASPNRHGSVHVLFGGRRGLKAAGDQVWHQDIHGVKQFAERGDRFGAALAIGDYNGDIYSDLVVGVPGEDVEGYVDAGVVHLLHGERGGLLDHGDEVWHQGSTGIHESLGSNDGFGAALAAGDFDGDGRDDLAVGVPRERIGAGARAGAVVVIYGDGNGRAGYGGLSEAGDELLHQGLDGIQGVPSEGDLFGGALTAGNFDGDGQADLAIGVAGTDLGAGDEHGALQIVYGTRRGLGTRDHLWSEASSEIKGVARSGDRFGEMLQGPWLS